MRHSVNLRDGASSRPDIKCTAPCTECTSVTGPVLSPGTQVPITMQGPAFPSIPCVPIMPRPQAQQSSKQAECEELARQHHDLEAREPEVEWRTRAINLNAVEMPKLRLLPPWRKAAIRILREQAPVKPKHVISNVTSQRSLVPPSGVKVTSTITTKTVKPPHASPQDGTGQDMKAMVQDMIRSSLTKSGVIPKETRPTQSHNLRGSGIPSNSRSFRGKDFQI